MKLIHLSLTFHLTFLLIISNAKGNLRIFKEWTLMDFQFSSMNVRNQAIQSGNFVASNVIPIDVDVNYRDSLPNSRIFMTFPRFLNGTPITLGYVKQFSSLIEPYPNYEYQSSSFGNDCSKLTSVFRVALDSCNQIWVLDSGKIGDYQHCPPQLLIFNLNTDKLVKRFQFPRNLYIGSSIFVTPILDIKDKQTCRDVKAYIADCCGFGIIVYDYSTNSAWRVNNKLLYPDPAFGSFNIAGESFDLMDGVLSLAITNGPLKQDKDRSLLFHALASGVESAVPLGILNNKTAWTDNENTFIYREKFQVIGTRGGQTAAQAMDKNGNLFFVLLNPPALVCWDSSKSYKMDNIKIVYQNPMTMQFASGLKIIVNKDGNEEIWIVTNRLQKFMNGNVSPSEINYRVHVGNVMQLLNNQPKCNGMAIKQPIITFPSTC